MQTEEGEKSTQYHPEFAESVVQHTPFPAMYVDAGMQIIFCNNEARAVIGIGTEVTALSDDILPRETRRELTRLIAQSCECNDWVSSDNTFRMNTVDERYYSLRVRQEVFPDGCYRFLVLAVDVTEVIERAEDFMAHVAHELRGPLAIIIGYIETILDRPDDFTKEKILQYIGKLGIKGRDMAELVEMLLELRRMRSSEECLQVENINPRPVAEAAIQGVQELIVKKNAEVRIEGEFPWVRCDPRRLAIVMGNLFSNAVKYGDGPGTPPKVKITAREQGDFVVFRVDDEGCGISVEDQARLFREFSTLQRDGVGLGLVLVHDIVKRSGGEVFIESVVGAGSTFGFTLPIAT